MTLNWRSTTRPTLLAAALVLLPALAGAATPASPVGLWKTIDDKTHTVTGLVRIIEMNRQLTGRVERVLDPTAKPGARCKPCTDERHDQPIEGLTILRGVRPSKDEAGVWEGGDILEPKTGKVYRVRLQIQNGGKTLEVRGYLGFFYRNQYWQRQE
jgi:uncharacterized protein (DUF2147 family)